MAKYSYNALKNNTQIIKGEVEASSPREAREKIRELGFLPTKVYAEFNENIPAYSEVVTNSENYNSRIKFLSLDEKILFTSEMELMLSSGIPILEVLHTIEINTPKIKLKQIAKELSDCIKSGMTFAQSLKSLYGELFGPVYVGLCLSGESAGELDVTLARMVELLKKQDAIKGKIISASTYPAILICVMFGVLVLFSKVVFPAFASVFAMNGADVPFMAAMLIGICNFVSNFWWLIIILAAAGIYSLKNLMKKPLVKNKIDNLVLEIPVLSDFIRYVNLSNFMSVLQVSYDAGIPIMDALELSDKTVGNYRISNDVHKTVELIKCGKSLTDSFSRTGILPPALITMIAAGEKSGNLGKMLSDVVVVIDKKIDIVLETLTRLFEPTVIVIMGVCVLFVAIAFYQMYFGMLGTLF